MTVIIATRWGGTTAIAADSFSGNVYQQNIAGESKLERYPWGIAGFSGTWRMRPVLHAALAKIKRLRTRDDAWALVAQLEEALKGAGWKREGDKELPSNDQLWMVLASRYGLWQLQPDLSIIPMRHIATTGCGCQEALAAAWTAQKLGVDAPDAARMGAEAACEFCPLVCRPVEVRLVE